ncbi:MAG: hypothetical protein ACI35P_07520 [Bacillus sp. (in: firmicutes)]
MKKTYKIQMEKNYPFDWKGFLECIRFCGGILRSIHLHSGEFVEIHEQLEFEGPYTLTRKSKDFLNEKIKSTYPLILKELTSHLNKGYMIIEAKLNQYEIARWQSFKFTIQTIEGAV